MNRRIGGIIFLKVDGQLYQAKGNFTYNLGSPKREALIGADGVHGFKETIQVPYVEGAISDSDELDLSKLTTIRDATVTLELANGKVFSLEQAWYAADGNVTTEEGEIQVRFEGITGREVQ
jgi:hypothetical protein